MNNYQENQEIEAAFGEDARWHPAKVVKFNQVWQGLNYWTIRIPEGRSYIVEEHRMRIKQ
jgi:hypothetical protein